MLNKEIIVIGGNHHNTLAILRSLGERRVIVNLILLTEEPKPYVSYSRYIENCEIISEELCITDALYRLHKSSDKAIIIACSDTISSYLDRNRDALCNDFILPGSKDQGRISKLMNKSEMLKLAQKCNIKVPKSWEIRVGLDPINEIEYPCITKPLASIGGSKADITICYSREDLEKHLQKSHCKEFQIQRYLTKELEYQLIGCSLNEGEEVIIPGASIILRQPETTNTGFLRYIPRKKFNFDYESCKKFIQATGYSGLFSLEFLRANNGEDYFMEINFRNDGNSICVTASGMNLPFIWYQHNSGNAIEDELCYDRMEEVIVMPEFNDIVNVLQHNISLWCWIRDILVTDRFMEFSKHDQKPFWIYIFKIIKTKVKRLS